MKNIKIVKNIEEANLVTHNGKFHLDELFSTILLSKIIDDVKVIRVSKIDKEYTNKIVYDIGLGEFDHHQKSRNGSRLNGIYFSSFGLLWKKMRKRFLNKSRVYKFRLSIQIF